MFKNVKNAFFPQRRKSSFPTHGTSTVHRVGSTFIGRVLLVPGGPHLHDEPRPVAEHVADDDDQRQFDGLELGRRHGRRRRRAAVVASGTSRSPGGGRARLQLGGRRASRRPRHGTVEPVDKVTGETFRNMIH